MSSFLGDTFSLTFLKDIAKCKGSITIITPYITIDAVKLLLEEMPKNRKCTIITQPPGIDYVVGGVDIEALQLLLKSGFHLNYLHNLHAKLYIIDDNKAYLGSANFTKSGWAGKEKSGNVEEMIKIGLTKVDLNHIYERYILPASPLVLDERLINEITEAKEIYKDFKVLINKLKDWERSVINPEPNAKVLYSKYFPAVKGYPYNFRFTISENVGNEIKQNKKDFIFKLGESKINPDAEIYVPFTIIKKVLTKSYLNSVKDWSFQISFDDKGDPYLRTTNFKTKSKEIIVLDKKNLQGKLKKIVISYK